LKFKDDPVMSGVAKIGSRQIGVTRPRSSGAHRIEEFVDLKLQAVAVAG
jgi:hypothetical protein